MVFQVTKLSSATNFQTAQMIHSTYLLRHNTRSLNNKKVYPFVAFYHTTNEQHSQSQTFHTWRPMNYAQPIPLPTTSINGLMHLPPKIYVQFLGRSSGLVWSKKDQWKHRDKWDNLVYSRSCPFFISTKSFFQKFILKPTGNNFST